LDQPAPVGYGAVAVWHLLGWHLGPSYTWYKRVWGWCEMRWWWSKNSMSELALPD
jgi:hypothetical protein